MQKKLSIGDYIKIYYPISDIPSFGLVIRIEGEEGEGAKAIVEEITNKKEHILKANYKLEESLVNKVFLYIQNKHFLLQKMRLNLLS